MFIKIKKIINKESVKTLSNFINPIWTKCNDDFCIGIIKKEDFKIIESNFKDIEVIDEDYFNIELLKTFGNTFDFEKEEINKKLQKYFWNGKEIIENFKSVEFSKEYIENEKQEKLKKLKQETAEKIYSKYSKEKQATYQMKATKILAKVMQGKELTEEDLEYKEKAEKMEEYISLEIENYKKEKENILNN